MKLKIKRLDPTATLPTYAHAGDAGLDMYANETVTIEPGEIGKIRSGVSLEIPEGYVGLFWDKSGLSTKNKIKTVAGVIDCGFRGEIVLCVMNLGREPFTFHKGERVLQMLLQKFENIELVEGDMMSETERGEKAFGSGKE
jgi:dUTP pyrophosphatase